MRLSPVWECEYEEIISGAGADLRREADKAGRGGRAAAANGHVLAPIDGKTDGKTGNRGAEVDLPQDCSGFLIERTESAVHVAAKD